MRAIRKSGGIRGAVFKAASAALQPSAPARVHQRPARGVERLVGRSDEKETDHFGIPSPGVE